MVNLNQIASSLKQKLLLSAENMVVNYIAMIKAEL